MTDHDRLFEVGRNLAVNDSENLANAMERFGARAATYLLPEPERWRRWMGADLAGPLQFVSIPAPLADAISAILFALPRGGKRGRRSQWPPDVESMAFTGLLERKPLNSLAREISQATGQPVSGTRRRLQEMKKSREVMEITKMMKIVRLPGAE